MNVWLAANVFALVLFGVVLYGWARSQPFVRPRAVAGSVCLVLAVTVLVAVFKRVHVPIGWVTVLHEGRSLRNVRQLYGRGVHAGAGFFALLDWLSGGDTTTLRTVVETNLGLAAMNTIVFFWLASYVLRSWCASLAFTLAGVCNLGTLHAACSETPAMLLSTHFWLGCICAAVIVDDAHATLQLRRLAWMCLAVLTALAATLRSESLVIGGPTVAVGAAKIFGWEQQVRQAMSAVGRWTRAVVAGRLPIFLLVIAALFALQCLPWMGSVSYVIDGIAPLNFSFLLLPQKLSIFLPWGLIGLFILGVIHAVRRWFSFFLLPITLLTLFKMYAAAAQGNYEHFRYLTFLTPVVLFLALFGFRELSDWAERWAWPSWWRRPAMVLIVLSMTAWQPLGPRELFSRRQQLAGVANAMPLLALNQQTEVRYLLDLVNRYPTCVFLAKGPQAEARTAHGPTGYRWAAFGAPLPHYEEMTDEGGELEQAVRQLAPGAPCVLFYRSLDCNLVDFDGCRAETERMAIEARRLDNLPYSDIGEYGAHRAEILLGVYPIRRAGADQTLTHAPQR